MRTVLWLLVCCVSLTVALAGSPAPPVPQATQPDAAVLQTAVREMAGGLAISKLEMKENRCTLSARGSSQQFVQFLERLAQTGQPIRLDSGTSRAPVSGKDDLDVELQFTFGAPAKESVPALAAIRELTMLFMAASPQPNSIWVDALTLKDANLHWEVSGLCTAPSFANDLYNAMAKSPRFKEPKLILGATPDDKGQSAYTIRFTFVPEAK